MFCMPCSSMQLQQACACLTRRKQQAAGQQAAGVRLQRALEDVQHWKAAAQQAAAGPAPARAPTGAPVDVPADAGKLLAGACPCMSPIIHSFKQDYTSPRGMASASTPPVLLYCWLSKAIRF